MINLDFHILVERISDKTEIFKKNFRMYMREIFLLGDQHKKHNLINHIYRMKNMIKMNHQKEVVQRMTKWHIYYVDFGINVGTEINGSRPAIVYKSSRKSFGEDIIVLPITGYTGEKSIDEFDIKVELHQSQGLSKASLVKTRQMRCVSKKRLGNFIGKITDLATKDKIQDALVRMMGLQIQKNSLPK